MIPFATVAPPTADRNAAPWSGPEVAIISFGLKCCCAKALTNEATVGTAVEPRITICGFFPATRFALGRKSGTSSGKIFEYDGADAGLLQEALRALDLQDRERVVGDRVGGAGRALPGRERLQPVHERVKRVGHRQRHVEDVRQLLAEHQRRAAGALDEREAVPVRHLGGRRGQQATRTARR